MSYKMLKFFKNLFSKAEESPPPQIRVGDKFLDKEWGDVTIEIAKISNSGTKYKYKFLSTGTTRNCSGDLYEMSHDCLLYSFVKIL